MQIIHHITTDMARRMPMVPVDAVQGDSNTRILKLKLLENGQDWAAPEAVTGAVAFRKSDGTKGLYDTLPDGTKAVSVEGSTVSAVLAPQVLTCAGEVSAAVVFHDENLNQLAAFPIVIRVAANPAAGQAASNDYYRYSTMEAVSESIDAFLSKAEEALQTVHDTATEDAPAIVCEADGEVISVADAADRPLKGLSIYGKTVQNGTPTPSAPVALESVGENIGVTVAGKNLLDASGLYSINGVAISVAEDGLVSLNGTAISEGGRTSSNAVVTLEPGMYRLQLYNKDGSLRTNVANRAFLSDAKTGGVIGDGSRDYTFTEKTIVKFGINVSNGTAYNDSFYAMLCYSSTDSMAYEPYKTPQTLTVSTQGGLHGIGEVKDEIDFARGVRVKQVEQIVLDGTEPVGLANSTSSQSWIIIDYNLPCALLRDKGYCSHFKYNQKLAGDGSVNYCGMQTSYTAEGKARLWITTTMSASEFKAFCAQQHAAGTPVTVQYVLAEPVETPLTAEELAQYAALRTGKPNTTVFNDSGADMKLNYVADTKLYIDQKIAAISAALLNT